MIKEILKKLLGASVYTSLAGYLAIALVFISAGGDIIESIIFFIDNDPFTVVDSEVFAAALETFGLGVVAGFLGIKARDNNVTSEEAKSV